MFSSSHNIIALVQTANAMPIMLLSIVAGALADNVDKRSVMLSAQMLTALTFLHLLTPGRYSFSLS